MDDFSHLDEHGKATMVDVSNKNSSLRTAHAQSIVFLPDEIISRLNEGDIKTKKGSVFQVAILAGIMGAKQTGNLIPLCHPLGLDNCELKLYIKGKNELVIDCYTTINAKTGVEMEALVGASIAALTVYDMCKAISHEMVIRETRLIEKKGGKLDFKRT